MSRRIINISGLHLRDRKIKNLIYPIFRPMPPLEKKNILPLFFRNIRGTAGWTFNIIYWKPFELIPAIVTDTFV